MLVLHCDLIAPRHSPLRNASYIRVSVSRIAGLGKGPIKASSRDGDPIIDCGSSGRNNEGSITGVMACPDISFIIFRISARYNPRPEQMFTVVASIDRDSSCA